MIDSSGLTPHELRDRVRDAFADAPPEDGLQVSVVSFGFKYGAPRDADLLFDVRLLPNPHWVPALRPLPGTDPAVRDHVRGSELYPRYLKRLEALLDVSLPGYVAEGKSYLTIAIGCTGGKHRSVAAAAALARRLPEHGTPARVTHRDIDKE